VSNNNIKTIDNNKNNHKNTETSNTYISEKDLTANFNNSEGNKKDYHKIHATSLWRSIGIELLSSQIANDNQTGTLANKNFKAY
jgi:hypothetical protein